MRRPALTLLRLLGIARPRPTTPLGRRLRRVERAFLMLGLAYATLHICPQPLFAHSVTARGITLYSRRPLPSSAVDRLVAARALLDRSELGAPARPARVFLCDSPGLYRAFAPLSGGSIAVSIPATGHIFVATADVAADLVTTAGGAGRSLSGVIAHEATHDLIRRRLGAWRSLTLPSWVVEGYCDYVAGSGGYPEAEGRAMLASGRPPDTQSARYYLYRRMVAHLLDDRHLGFDQLVARAGEGDTVERATRAAARGAGGP